MNTKNLYRSCFGKGLVAAFFSVRKATDGIKKSVVKVCEFDGTANAPVIRTKNGNLLTVHEMLTADGENSADKTARILKGTGNYGRACFIARVVAHASNGGIYCPAAIEEAGKDYATLMASQNRDNRRYNARIDSEPDYRAECAHMELIRRGTAMRKAQERYLDCDRFVGICDEEAEVCDVNNFGDDSFLG